MLESKGARGSQPELGTDEQGDATLTELAAHKQGGGGQAGECGGGERGRRGRRRSSRPASRGSVAASSGGDMAAGDP